MPSVDVVDETWFAVPARVLAAVFADARAWPRIWPDLDLEVFADRGEQGIRWTVDGAWVGSMEVWLEQVWSDGATGGSGNSGSSGGPGATGEPGYSAAEAGTLLHYYLRLDARDQDGAPRSLPPRRAAAEAARRHRAAKRFALTLKRHLEGARAPGEPPGRS